MEVSQPRTLPLEILILIMAFVAKVGKAKDLLSCTLVCWDWRAACRQGIVWELLFKKKWKKHYPALKIRCAALLSMNVGHHETEETFWRRACKDKAAPKLQWKPGSWRYCWWKRWQPRALQLSASGQLIAFAGNQGEGGEPAISLAKSPLHSVTMQDDIEMELHYTGMITSTKCRPCEQALMSWMKGDTLLASSGVFEEHSGGSKSVLIHDVESGKVVSSVTITGNKRRITAMKADTNKVVVGTSPGALLLYDLRGKTTQATAPVWSWEDHTPAINTLQFNNKCCIAGSADGTIKRFDWRMIKKKDLQPTIGVLYSSVSQLVFEGSHLFARDSHSNLYHFDLNTQEQLGMTKHGKPVCTGSPLFINGDTLVHASVVGIATWETESQKKKVIARMKPCVPDFTGMWALQDDVFALIISFSGFYVVRTH